MNFLRLSLPCFSNFFLFLVIAALVVADDGSSLSFVASVAFSMAISSSTFVLPRELFHRRVDDENPPLSLPILFVDGTWVNDNAFTTVGIGRVHRAADRMSAVNVILSNMASALDQYLKYEYPSFIFLWCVD